MVIGSIHIDGFGKLSDLNLSFKRGVNILLGANETGKSTLHLFVRSMLYGASNKRESGRPSVYERMRPWEQSSRYGGSMDVYKDGILYRISRDFNKSWNDLSIVNLSVNKEEVSSQEAFMEELVAGLSETAFLNTASMSQLKGRTDQGMVNELRRYAENTSATQNPDLSADKALTFLQKEKKRLEDSLQVDAARDYNTLLAQEKKLVESIRDPHKENRISEYTSAHDAAYARAGEAAMRLSDEEMTITEHENTLAAYGIRSEEDVDELGNKVTVLYKKHKNYLPSAIILDILGLILIGVCILTTPSDFYQYLSESRVIISLGIGAAGLILVIIAIVLFAKSKRLKNTLRLTLDEHLKNTEELKNKWESNTKAPIKDENRENDEKSSAKVKLRDRLAEFSDELQTYKKELKNIASMKKEHTGLMESLKELNSRVNEYAAKLEDQRKIQSEVEVDIVGLDSVQRKINRLEKVLDENKEARDDIDAISLAEETLRKLSADIKKSVGAYINKEAGRMMEGFSAGKYGSVDAGSNYNISVNFDSGFIPLASLSRGTIDQLYLAVRIASLRFMAGEDDRVPLFLDESFVLFDNERLESALRLLTSNYKGQIFIFSCQDREEKMLSSLDITHATIRL